MQGIKSIKDAEIQGKRVLVRVDFNVPLNTSGAEPVVVDDSRIRAAMPTIEYLHEQGAAKIILLTHIGRPKGVVVETLKVAPVQASLQKFIKYPEVELHENLRFDPREEANDEAFAKELAALGDIYVNEAFPVSHRADASIVGIPKLLPSYAGLRFQEEVEHIATALTPSRPALAILGGAKFETKEPLIQKLLPVYDAVILGGALANDLLKARGMPVGVSLVSEKGVPPAIAENTKIHAPIDIVVVQEDISRAANTADVRDDESIVDIGEQTVAWWSKQIQDASFVLWNGPTGVYEKGYVQATNELAETLAQASCKALIGGGDTVAALSKYKFDQSRIFISTGGGAMLQFLADGTLPGIEALKQA